MKAVLIGYGEIGKGIFDVFSKYHEISIQDPAKGYELGLVPCDIILVAIPFNDNFETVILEARIKCQCMNILVFSTVPIGTCSKIRACHCPIEGKHPNLAESIRRTDKWLGGENKICEKFLKDAEFNIIKLNNPSHTEFLKLRSTTLYGINIEFARYSKEVCGKLGLDYDFVKKWDNWVNDLYISFNMNWAMRYILDPPNGPKGGHCVTSNAKILNKQYPNDIVKIVAEE